MELVNLNIQIMQYWTAEECKTSDGWMDGQNIQRYAQKVVHVTFSN